MHEAAGVEPGENKNVFQRKSQKFRERKIESEERR